MWSFGVLHNRSPLPLFALLLEAFTLPRAWFSIKPLFHLIQNLMVAVVNDAVSTETDWKRNTVERLDGCRPRG